MLEETLKQLGLDEKEVLVYLAIIKSGKARASVLGRILSIKRTTVYSVVKQLLDKNLIHEDLGGPVLSYVARSPENILTVIRNEESKLRDKKLLAQKAVEELEKLLPQIETHLPKIIFIPQHQIEQHLYKQTPLWVESIRKKDKTWWGFQDHTFVQSYEKWIDWSWESGVQTGINLKLLSNHQEKLVKKKQFVERQIKFWSQSQNFTASLWVCGDYVISLVTNKNPHYLVEQNDSLLAQNLREVFKGIWNTQIETN